MTAEPETPAEHGADVIPLRAEDAHTETGLAEANGPAYLDATGTGDAKRLPIIPAHLHRAQIAKTAAEALGLHWYKARYHGLRSPDLRGQDGLVRAAGHRPPHRAGAGLVALDGRVAARIDGRRRRAAGASRRDERPP